MDNYLALAPASPRVAPRLTHAAPCSFLDNISIPTILLGRSDCSSRKRGVSHPPHRYCPAEWIVTTTIIGSRSRKCHRLSDARNTRSDGITYSRVAKRQRGARFTACPCSSTHRIQNPTLGLTEKLTVTPDSTALF